MNIPDPLKSFFYSFYRHYRFVQQLKNLEAGQLGMAVETIEVRKSRELKVIVLKGKFKQKKATTEDFKKTNGEWPPTSAGYYSSKLATFDPERSIGGMYNVTEARNGYHSFEYSIPHTNFREKSLGHALRR